MSSMAFRVTQATGLDLYKFVNKELLETSNECFINNVFS